MTRVKTLGATVLGFALCAGLACTAQAEITAPTTEIPLEFYITPNRAGGEHTWEEAVAFSQERPLMIDVTATWCGPCKQLKPILQRKVKEGNGSWTLAFLDVDANKGQSYVPRTKYVPSAATLKKGKTENIVDGMSLSKVDDYIKNKVLG